MVTFCRVLFPGPAPPRGPLWARNRNFATKFATIIEVYDFSIKIYLILYYFFSALWGNALNFVSKFWFSTHSGGRNAHRTRLCLFRDSKRNFYAGHQREWCAPTSRYDVVARVKPEVVLFNPLRSTLNFSPRSQPPSAPSTVLMLWVSFAVEVPHLPRRRTNLLLPEWWSAKRLYLGELQITPDCLESLEMGSYLSVVGWLQS